MNAIMQNDVVEWIRAGLKQKGKTQSGLAMALGIAQPQISRILKGERRVYFDEIPKISAYLEIDTPFSAGQSLTKTAERIAKIPIRGEVAAGLWREYDELSQDLGEPTEYAPTVVLEGYPKQQQFALRVRGESLNKIAPDGSILHCLEYINGDAWNIKDGDLVVVQRSKFQGAMIETTAKRVRKKGETYELWPESSHPDFQEPLIVPELHDVEAAQEIRIFAKVLRIIIEP